MHCTGAAAPPAQATAGRHRASPSARGRLRSGQAPMSKTSPVWPAGAAQAADWPRLAEASGSLRHDLALKPASGEPAGRALSHLVFHIGEHAAHWAAEFGPAYTFQPTAPQQRQEKAGCPLLAAAVRPAAAAEVFERPTPRSLGAALWSISPLGRGEKRGCSIDLRSGACPQSPMPRA